MITPKSARFQPLTLPQKIGLSGLVGVVLIILGVLAAPHVPRMRDFDQTFYPAIRYALAGQNPYIGILYGQPTALVFLGAILALERKLLLTVWVLFVPWSKISSFWLQKVPSP